MKKKVTLLWILLIVGIAATGCGPRETIVADLGNAENSLFTPDGRLFITGHKIWEIEQIENRYHAVSLTDEMVCEFSGIAFYNAHLFAICYADEQNDAWLLRAELTDVPQFEKVYQIQGMTLANGMVVDGSGHLYIADETVVSPTGKIIRLSLTDDPVPRVVESSYTVWLTAAQGAQAPNGLEIVGDTLFFSNLDTRNFFNIRASIKRVSIQGDQAGEVETVFERPAMRNSSIFDDFTSIDIAGNTLLIVADYLRGTVLTLDAFATDQSAPLFETDPDKFAGPTSCIVGQGLGFGTEDLLVTEGGIVTIDPNSGFGNRLSRVQYQAGN